MMCRFDHGKILRQKTHTFRKFPYLTIGTGIMRAKHHVIGRRSFRITQRRHALCHAEINTIPQARQLLRQHHHLNVFRGRVGRTRGAQCRNAVRTCRHQAFHAHRLQMIAELLLEMRPQFIAAHLVRQNFPAAQKRDSLHASRLTQRVIHRLDQGQPVIDKTTAREKHRLARNRARRLLHIVALQIRIPARNRGTCKHIFK